MSSVQTGRELYRVTITGHDVEHAVRVPSDLACALSATGLATHAAELHGESDANDVVIVFGGLEAGELPPPSDDQDAVEAEALRDVGLLRKKPAAVIPAVRALLALSRAREAGKLDPQRRMTVEIEPE